MEDDKEQGIVKNGDDGNFPFPHARVDAVIRENLKKDHMVSRNVVEAANLLLGEILGDMATQMDSSPYYKLTLSDFERVCRKYKEAELTGARLEKVKKMLEKEVADINVLVLELEQELQKAAPKEK